MEREDNTKRKKGSIFELSGVPGFYESFPLALQHVVAMDAARSTIRLGVAKVRIVYRRREEDMAALAGEVEGAMAEDCQMVPLAAPMRIEADGENRVVALWGQP